MKAIRLTQALLAGALAASLSANAAVSIFYSATDIADVAAQELWRYTYLVDGLASGESIRISFDAAVHTPLSVDTATSDWFSEVDAGGVPAGADGHFLATRFNGASPGNFALTVARLAPGPVGPQAFEHLDAGFDVLGGGATAPIPEPGTWALFGLGALLLAARSARRR